MAELQLRARAPAKVNLVLRVGPRREDGYHDLATLLAPLDLCDEIGLVVSRGRRGPVSCRAPGRPDLDGPGNLAARAAEAFRRRFGTSDRIAIRVEKRIPVTAGLGGGSSDAAAVIRCLARAYRIRDRAALAEVALAVGSDVPFFLGSGPAWATGRGERLEPVRLQALHLVLVYPCEPALAIRASEAYAWLDEARGASASSPEHAVKTGVSGTRLSVRRTRNARLSVGGGQLSVRDTRGARLSVREAQLPILALENDLEPGCFARRPELARLRRAVAEAGALSAIMSGSGPTVFGLFASRAAAVRGASLLRGAGVPGLLVHVARTRQRLPGVTPWRSPRSASSRSRRRSSRPT